MTTATGALVLMAFVLTIGGCADDNSPSTALNRIDTVKGIKVTVTGCEATPLPPTTDGWEIPRTEFSAEGTVENTSDETRAGVKVHVAFNDGDHEFYDSDVDDVYSFGGYGLDDGKETFSFSVTLSDEVTDLQCKAIAHS